MTRLLMRLSHASCHCPLSPRQHEAHGDAPTSAAAEREVRRLVRAAPAETTSTKGSRCCTRWVSRGDQRSRRSRGRRQLRDGAVGHRAEQLGQPLRGNQAGTHHRAHQGVDRQGENHRIADAARAGVHRRGRAAGDGGRSRQPRRADYRLRIGDGEGVARPSVGQRGEECLRAAVPDSPPTDKPTEELKRRHLEPLFEQMPTLLGWPTTSSTPTTRPAGGQGARGRASSVVARRFLFADMRRTTSRGRLVGRIPPPNKRSRTARRATPGRRTRRHQTYADLQRRRSAPRKPSTRGPRCRARAERAARRARAPRPARYASSVASGRGRARPDAATTPTQAYAFARAIARPRGNPEAATADMSAGRAARQGED